MPSQSGFSVLPQPVPSFPSAGAGGAPGQPITVPIPEEFVGSILGRGGSVIAELQTTSGARIQVNSRFIQFNTF